MTAAVGQYVNRYAGRRFVIIGKGPTRFQFENLTSVDDPIIFINDVVQFECFARHSVETFFFAHDTCQAVWLTPKLRSAAVIARAEAKDRTGRAMLCAEELPGAGPPCSLVTYEWGGWYGEDEPACAGRLSRCGREQIARTGKLYLNSGTIHTAIHFAWLCGASKITFIGCDGFAGSTDAGKTYDRRIDLKSDCRPVGVFAKIRQVQDRMCAELGIETEYVNEPRLEKIIPAIAHFIWFGPIPQWARDNIDAFRKMHRDWHVRVWTDLPSDMPAELVKAAVDAEQYCSRSDVLSYWLLYRHGGLYLDCDVMPLRSMEPLRRYTAFACRQHDGRVNCAVLGAIPGSAAFDLLLRGVRERHGRIGSEKRTVYGPQLLTDLFGADGERSARHLSVLPRHYFYLFVDQKAAHPFWRASATQRNQILREHRDAVTDPTEPYGVHLWGVDGSSKRAGFGRGDALGYRLRCLAVGREKIAGAEIGVLVGRLSEHILRLVPNLHLYMVDRWVPVNPNSRYARSGDSSAKLSAAGMERVYRNACERTEFAAERRTMIRAESVDAAKQIADGSLDFVFIDADHTYEGVRQDLDSWYPKVRPGGLISGHDMDNPLQEFKNPNWGVRRAVEEFMALNCPNAEMELGAEYTWFFTKPACGPKGQVGKFDHLDKIGVPH